MDAFERYCHDEDDRNRRHWGETRAPIRELPSYQRKRSIQWLQWLIRGVHGAGWLIVTALPLVASRLFTEIPNELLLWSLLLTACFAWLRYKWQNRLGTRVVLSFGRITTVLLWCTVTVSTAWFLVLGPNTWLLAIGVSLFLGGVGVMGWRIRAQARRELAQRLIGQRAATEVREQLYGPL